MAFILSRLVKQVHEYEEQLKTLKVTHDGRRVKVRWQRVPTVRKVVHNVHAELLASDLLLDKAPSERTTRRCFDQYIGKGTFSRSHSRLRARVRRKRSECAHCASAPSLARVCLANTAHNTGKDQNKCYCYSLRPHSIGFEKQSRARRGDDTADVYQMISAMYREVQRARRDVLCV